MSRTRIYLSTSGYVVLCYYNSEGSLEIREFTQFRGYVRELRDGDWHQVCEGLEYMGDTLPYTDKSPPLIDVIRYHYRKFRRNNLGLFNK